MQKIILKLWMKATQELLYTKYLLSEANETKIEYLFLLEDLFQKSKLINIYSKFLSDKIRNWCRKFTRKI